jgi:xanthine/CO dehydrogenase XdhC/CoxF family maturation factor
MIVVETLELDVYVLAILLEAECKEVGLLAVD